MNTAKVEFLILHKGRIIFHNRLQETTGNPAITVELTNHVESDWEINESALLELISL